MHKQIDLGQRLRGFTNYSKERLNSSIERSLLNVSLVEPYRSSGKNPSCSGSSRFLDITQNGKHPKLKGVEIMTKETLNETFIYVKIGNAQILCIYYPPSCLTDLDTGLEEIFLKCIISRIYGLMAIGDLSARRSKWRDLQRSANEQRHKEFMEAFELNRYDIGRWSSFIKSMTRSRDGWPIIDFVLPNNNLLYDWVKEYQRVSIHKWVEKIWRQDNEARR